MLLLAVALSLNENGDILNFYTNSIHSYLQFYSATHFFSIHFILPSISLQSSPLLCNSFQSSPLPFHFNPLQFISIHSSTIHFNPFLSLRQSIHPFLSLPLYNPFIHSSPYLSTLTLSTKYKSLSILSLHKKFDLNSILSRSLPCFFLTGRLSLFSLLERYNG